MARLIPKIPLDEISLKPERDVARALIEQLPPDSVVYHSYPWLKPDRNTRGNTILREGEADFVIVMPEVGLLVLEVKGGTILYDPENRLWHRLLADGCQRDINDPFEQARRNTYALRDTIIKVSFPGEKTLPCPFGYAVVFPDCIYSGPLPPGGEASIIFSANDLPYLGRRIPSLLRKWNPQVSPRPLSRQELDKLFKGLSPTFQILPVLFRRLEEQEARLFRLTQEQMSILTFLQNQKRAAIQGVAGSGKTLLAMAQAQRFADQGRLTLLVCYNRQLAEWLQASLPDTYQDTITISTFHQLCRKTCQEADIPFEVDAENPQEFWNYMAPLLLIEAIENSARRFDAIVVDEGQDFREDWWDPLEMLLKEDGAFFVFYDPRQNLFAEANLPPKIGYPYILPTNCRNTKQIAKLCGQVRGIDIRVRNDAPEGDKTIINVAPTVAQQVRFCQQIVSEWLVQGRLRPSQIVIQSPRRRTNSSLKDLHAIRNVPITENLEEWRSGAGILFATIRRFKGLEADAVLITDIVPLNSLPHFTAADLYVACSRAKHLLAILPISEGIL